jgi:hypothetical protein
LSRGVESVELAVVEPEAEQHQRAIRLVHLSEYALRSVVIGIRDVECR